MSNIKSIQEVSYMNNFQITLETALSQNYQGFAFCMRFPNAQTPRYVVLVQLLDQYRRAGWTDINMRRDQQNTFLEFAVDQDKLYGE